MAQNGTRKKSGSTTGKTNKGRQTAAQRKAAYERKKQSYAIRREILWLVSLAICIILFLCNFGVVGAIGDKISNLMFGLFGTIAYAFPILCLVLGVYSRYHSGSDVSKNIFAIIGFLDLGILFELFRGIELDKYSIKAIYENSRDTKTGGGALSGSVCYALRRGIGDVGTIIVVVLIVLICIIVILNQTVISKLESNAGHLFDKSEEERQLRREYNDQKRQEYEERREVRSEQRRIRNEEKREQALERAQYMKERELARIESEKKAKEESERKSLAKEDEKLLRKDKKVSGVTFNTQIAAPGPRPNPAEDDIHEITLNGFNAENIEDNDDFFGSREISSDIPPVQRAGNSQLNEITINEEDNYNREPQKPDLNIVGSRPEHRNQSATANTNTGMAKTENSNRDVVLPVSQSTSNVPKKYKFPPITLLNKNQNAGIGDSDSSIRETAQRLIDTLETFGVRAKIDTISQGPTVTRFELLPELGTKVSKIKGLTDDIKLSLAAADIRIEAPIPGKSAIGIEVPNKVAQAVLLRDLLETNEFKSAKSPLTFGVGKDIAGKVIVYDIDKFPHLLIAGATGSGKSVCINTMIMSIIYKANPDDVKLIMIDPKVVELSVYNGIPHLLVPVVTEPKKAAASLNWAVNEMMERYRKFETLKVRDIEGYNNIVTSDEQYKDSEIYKKLPQIVIIVDELADLMMVARNEVEDSITRLTQLARAAGIYLIVATQRPSVDVITGVIKSNMPSRMAFAVASGVDSRTILDMNGAEELMGKGDMLFFPRGLKKPVRLQGGFVDEHEVEKVVDFLKENSEGYVDEELVDKVTAVSASSQSSDGGDSAEFDELFMDCAKFIIETDKASIGGLQRRFRVGFNRAARIMDKLAELGVVSEDEGTKARRVLMNLEEFENMVEENGL